MVLGGNAVLYRSRFMLLSTYYISVGGMKAQKTGPVAYCDHPLPVRIYSKPLLSLFSQVCVITIGELRQGPACFRIGSITSIVSIIVDIVHPSDISRYKYSMNCYPQLPNARKRYG
jgi:hypothetical protein